MVDVRRGRLRLDVRDRGELTPRMDEELETLLKELMAAQDRLNRITIEVIKVVASMREDISDNAKNNVTVLARVLQLEEEVRGS